MKQYKGVIQNEITDNPSESPPSPGRSKEIEDAIKLLKDNGYVMKEFTKIMEKDSEECEKLLEQGEYMDCCGCSCNICVIQ